ncbi:hypothetical protein K4H96_0924 [Streptococcus sanguinis]|nr:hypothetical protein [Streptococcus sanguinis]
MTSIVSAEVAYPAPYPIIDEWNYGVNDNYGYSNYYVKSPNNIGSKSSITNLWGTVKSSDSQKYGWAIKQKKSPKTPNFNFISSYLYYKRPYNIIGSSNFHKLLLKFKVVPM